MPVIDLHLQQRTPHATASRAESRGSTVTSLAAERAPAGMRLALELAGQRCEAATRADHAAFLLRDLAEAATAVCEGRSARSLVSFYDTPWGSPSARATAPCWPACIAPAPIPR